MVTICSTDILSSSSLVSHRAVRGSCRRVLGRGSSSTVLVPKADAVDVDHVGFETVAATEGGEGR